MKLENFSATQILHKCNMQKNSKIFTLCINYERSGWLQCEWILRKESRHLLRRPDWAYAKFRFEIHSEIVPRKIGGKNNEKTTDYRWCQNQIAGKITKYFQYHYVLIANSVANCRYFTKGKCLRQFAQCRNFRIFLSFRFYVNSVLYNVEVLKPLFLLFLGLWILLIW